MKTKLQKDFPKLFAKCTTCGPADAAELLKQLHGAGMVGAAWMLETVLEYLEDIGDNADRIEELDDEVEDLKEKVSGLEDSLYDMRNALDESSLIIKHLEEQREELENQLDQANEREAA